MNSIMILSGRNLMIFFRDRAGGIFLPALGADSHRPLRPVPRQPASG